MIKRRGTLIPGVLLILLGLYFLAAQLNIPLPALNALWPGIVVLAGLLFLGDFAFGGRRDSGQLFTGLAVTLIGAFFFLFTLHVRLPLPSLQDGLDWPDMARLWPTFLGIGGLAFIGQWLAFPDHHGARNAGLIALVLGLAGLAIKLSLNDEGLVRQILRLWPLLLVAAGVQLLLRYLRRGRTN